MPALLLQTWITTLPWDKILYGGQGIAVLVIIAIVLLKWLPVYRDLKSEEFKVRDRESASRTEQAQSSTAIAQALYEVAVEQRRAADAVKVLQRINSTKVDDLEAGVTDELELHDRRLAALERLKDDLNATTANPAGAN